MNYKGAVFFDADGTLIDNPAGISKPTASTVNAIRQLQKNGWLTGLATGRAKCYTPAGTENLFDCYVTSNGAYAEVQGKMICSEAIPAALLDELLSWLTANHYCVVVEGQEFCGVTDLSDPDYQHMMANYCFSAQKHFSLQESGRPNPVHKLMAAYSRKEMFFEFQKKFGAVVDITNQPGNQAADVGQKGISKAYGVRKILEALHIPLEHTYAFGDADNDLTLLETAGIGIAMGRCTPDILQAAAYHTSTVAEEGITQGLLHFDLI